MVDWVGSGSDLVKLNQIFRFNYRSSSSHIFSFGNSLIVSVYFKNAFVIGGVEVPKNRSSSLPLIFHILLSKFNHHE